jgi:hypothetical protein
VAISAAVLLIPAALLLLGSRKKGGPGRGYGGGAQQSPYKGGWQSRDAADGLTQQTEDGYPLSDSMRLNADCSGPAARTIKWRYDLRITGYYWYMRRELGMDDPVEMTAAILAFDSPHCQWPPAPDASEWAHIIWDGTYAAVKNYFDLEQTGELWDYAMDPWDPEEGMHVKPLVAWA